MNNNRVSVFPYTIIRTGGVAYSDTYASFYSHNLKNLVETLLSIREELTALKLNISNLLYDYIKNQKDSLLRNEALNLKRDIYNERSLHSNSLEVLISSFSRHLQSQITYFINLLEKHNTLKNKIDQVYEQELNNQYHNLLNFVNKDYNLQGGIILSSEKLYDRYIKVNLRHNKGAFKFNKKEILCLNTIAKYVYRASTKTSPFSTFGNIMIGEIEDQEDISFDEETFNDINHEIRLNSNIFKYVKIVLEHFGCIDNSTYFRINETLSNDDAKLIFFVNQHNTEAFLKLEVTPLIECILSLFNDNDVLKFRDLFNKIGISNSFSRTEIESYIYKLLELGFIELHFKTSSLDPNWCRKLIDEISSHEDQNLHVVRKSLVQLDQLNELIEKSDNAKDRKRIIKKAHNILVDLPKKLTIKKSSSAYDKKIPAFPFRPEEIFYEDTVRASKASVGKSVLESLVTELQDLFSTLSFSQNQYLVKYHVKQFFLQRYGKKARIDLLDFYADYFEYWPPATYNSLVEKWKATAYLVFKNEHGINHKSTVLNIKKEHLDIITESAKINSKLFKNSGSFNAFIQLVNDHSQCVLNSYNTGFGKMFSRFLYYMNEDVTEAFIKRNRNYQNKDFIFAELSDASHFNANIHPLLHEKEISFPGCQTHSLGKSVIPICDLEILYDSAVDDIYLYDKKCKNRITPLDIGIQHGYRSDLFNFLKLFSYNDLPNVHHITTIINKVISDCISKSEKWYKLPRILFNNKIIIQRETWVIQKNTIPSKTNLSDTDYLLEIQKWRIELKLPEEAFLIEETAVSDSMDSSKTVYKRKPLYICFYNMFTLNIFEKIIKKTRGKVIIEEMLPQSHEYEEVSKKKHVTELLIQWDTTAK